MTAAAVFKSFVRRFLRRLAPFAYRRPRLMKLAGAALALFPSFKVRLRNAVMPALPATVPPANLNDAQLRVLLDLRDAVGGQTHTWADRK